MRPTIDLNADVGESFGAWQMGLDAQLMPLITSANIACGFHAGDPAVMERTVALALQHGVAIGAHPALPDLSGFGRRPMQITPDEAYQLVLYQSGALRAFIDAQGGQLHHVKPHGALYNMAADDVALSRGIVRAVKALGQQMLLVVPAGSVTEGVARDAGLRVVREFFADRRYQACGRLVSRSHADALITDQQESIDQVLTMIQTGHCITVSGERFAIEADTVCIHGDHPQAIDSAQALRAALTAAGIQIQAIPFD
jgi:5-oxoprolinase (ATP-hydrolysing) subunit A